MTESQRYLRDRHIEHVEQRLEKIEAAGFELVELGEWYGGQPHTEFRHQGGRHILQIFGYARCELRDYGGTKLDGCRLCFYTTHTLDRVLARVGS